MSGAIGGRGAAGPQGPAGPAGQSATVAVGQVTAQAAATAAASVVNSGTSSAAVLDFAFDLPKGDKGDTGATGAQGPAGPSGPAPVFGTFAATSLPTGDPPTVAAVGDGSAANPLALTFGIPAGQSGSQGAPPVFGSPQTGEPGTNVSLTGVGTAADPVILTIPRGNPGPTGPEGSQGPQGPQGPPGDSYLAEATTTKTSVLTMTCTSTTPTISMAVDVTTPRYYWGTNYAYAANWKSSASTVVTFGIDQLNLTWRGIVLASQVSSLTASSPGAPVTVTTTSNCHMYGSQNITVSVAFAANSLLSAFKGLTLTLNLMYPCVLIYKSNSLFWGAYGDGDDVTTTNVVASGTIAADGSVTVTGSYTMRAYSPQEISLISPLSNIQPIVLSGTIN